MGLLGLFYCQIASTAASIWPVEAVLCRTVRARPVDVAGVAEVLVGLSAPGLWRPGQARASLFRRRVSGGSEGSSSSVALTV